MDMVSLSVPLNTRTSYSPERAVHQTLPNFATPMTHQRLAGKRAATQKIQGSIIERLGGEIWRQEATAEVRDNANVSIVSAHYVKMRLFLARSTTRCWHLMVVEPASATTLL